MMRYEVFVLGSQETMPNQVILQVKECLGERHLDRANLASLQKETNRGAMIFEALVVEEGQFRLQ
jgi:hypothetical protein